MDKKLHMVILLILFALTALAGCASTTPSAPGEINQDAPGEKEAAESPDPPVDQPGSIPAENTPDRSDRIPGSTLPPGLERVETPPSEPVTGEVPPEILDEIYADLLERTAAERGEIQLIRAEAVVWNDGSLGCPKPGEFYIQVLINGYWVVLEIDDKAYDYRVSDSGYFTLCEGSGPRSISPPGDPGTGISPDQ